MSLHKVESGIFDRFGEYTTQEFLKVLPEFGIDPDSEEIFSRCEERSVLSDVPTNVLHIDGKPVVRTVMVYDIRRTHAMFVASRLDK